MSRVIGSEEFRAALAFVVDTFGEDYQYNNTGNPDASCYYVARTRDELDALDNGRTVEDDNRTKSGCIIGEAIAILLPEVDRTQLYGGITPASESLVRYYGVELTGAVQGAAMAAQRAQDQGSTWGEALSAFDSDLVHQNATVPDYLL